jgi:hypothetical protein
MTHIVLAPAAAPAATRPYVVAFALAAVCVIAVAFFMLKMWDAALTRDVPWLLRTGQFILDNGRLPSGDLFSWTAPDRPLLLYQWLFMVLVAAIERVGGMEALLVVHVGLAGAIYLLGPLFVAVPRRVPPAFTIVVGAFVLAIASVNFTLRPMIATAALLLLQYAIVQGLRRRRLTLRAAGSLIVVVYVAWANLHNGVVLGLGSLALFAIGDLVERCRFYRFDPEDPDVEGQPLPAGRYAVLAGAAIVASLVNPYGIGIYAHLVEFSSQPYLSQVIQELRSPDFHGAQFRLFLLLIAALGLLMMRARRALAAADLLHLAAFTVATLICARFVVWAVLLYGLILPRALHHVWTARPNLRADIQAALCAAATTVRRAAAVAVFGAVAGLAVWLAATSTRVGDRCAGIAPTLAAYGTRVSAGEHTFMSPEAGSCAIAQASGFRVFIDTRFDFYGDAIAADAFGALRLQTGWKETLGRWRVDRLIVERRWPLAQALAIDPDFQILYEDAVAIIARPSS